jgi:hypothetical protein
MLRCSKSRIPRLFTMFSLISLYFASRRDILLAERYVAGLTETPPAAAPVAAKPTATAPEPVERISLAA